MTRIVLLLAGAWLVGACGGRPVELTLATPELERDRTIATRLVELLGEQRLVSLRLASTDRNASALDMVSNGDADLALVDNNEPFRPDISTIAPLYATVLHVAFRAELAYETLDQAIGADSVYAGPPGSVTRRMLERAASAFVREPAPIRYVDGRDCADVLVVFTPIQPDVPERVTRCGTYRLLSLGEPDEIGRGALVDAIVLFDPRMRAFVIPRRTYGVLTPEPTTTVAVDKLLVGRRDLAPAVVFDLIDELVSLRPAIATQNPAALHRLSSSFDLSDATYPVHQGAEDWLVREEPNFYERYSGIAEVVATLMIALVSGTFGLMKLRERRRKNRIDTFYAEVLAIRTRSAEMTDRGGLDNALRQLRTLEARAFDWLMDEKLAADESFRIFVTLIQETVRDHERRLAAVAARAVAATPDTR